VSHWEVGVKQLLGRAACGLTTNNRINVHYPCTAATCTTSCHPVRRLCARELWLVLVYLFRQPERQLWCILVLHVGRGSCNLHAQMACDTAALLCSHLQQHCDTAALVCSITLHSGAQNNARHNALPHPARILEM
jgi:hypothetical protein